MRDPPLPPPGARTRCANDRPPCICSVSASASTGLVLLRPNGPGANPERLERQARDWKAAADGLDASIPMVCVCGNHDVGNRPNSATISAFRDRFGDDYFGALPPPYAGRAPCSAPSLVWRSPPGLSWTPVAHRRPRRPAAPRRLLGRRLPIPRTEQLALLGNGARPVAWESHARLWALHFGRTVPMCSHDFRRLGAETLPIS